MWSTSCEICRQIESCRILRWDATLVVMTQLLGILDQVINGITARSDKAALTACTRLAPGLWNRKFESCRIFCWDKTSLVVVTRFLGILDHVIITGVTVWSNKAALTACTRLALTRFALNLHYFHVEILAFDKQSLAPAVARESSKVGTELRVESPK